MADVTPKGFSTFIGGMNNLLSPEYLDDTQYARGTNGVNRGGHWKTRPRLKKVVDLPSGRFQGMFNYRDRQYAFVEGSAYSEKDGVVADATSGVTLAPLPRRVYATETNDHLVVSDGVGNVVVVGDLANRHMGEDELSANVGLVHYGNGRIFFTDRARRTLMASDIYTPGEPDSVLGITEQQVLNERLSIMQPGNFGKIQVMSFIRNSESGSGLSQLICFSEGGVSAYNVYLPRASDAAQQVRGWLDSQIGATMFIHGGVGGSLSVVPINNDLFYRPDSGISTLGTQISAIDSSIRSIPVSINISPLLDRDEMWTLEHVSATTNDNYVLYTHGLRVDTDGDYYFDSIVPIDLVSFFSQGDAQMTVDGVWTDKKFLQVLTGQYMGRRETFVVVKEDNNANVLYMLTQEAIESPRTRLITKKVFYDTAYQFFRSQYADLWFEDIKTDLNVKLYFRGDAGPWLLAGEGDFNVPYYDETTYDVRSQIRSKVRVSLVSSVCDLIANTPADKACMFQICVEFTGIADLPRMLFVPKESSGGNVGETLLCQEESAGIVLTNPSVIYDYDFLENEVT